jgi:hypothetical protein
MYLCTSTGSRCSHCVHVLATGLPIRDRVAHSDSVPLPADRAFVTLVCSLQVSVVSRNFHLTEEMHLGALMHGQEISRWEGAECGMRTRRQRVWLTPAQTLPPPAND